MGDAYKTRYEDGTSQIEEMNELLKLQSRQIDSKKSSYDNYDEEPEIDDPG